MRAVVPGVIGIVACQSGPPWTSLYIQLDLPGFAVPVPGVEIGMLLNLLVGSEIQNARVMYSTHVYKRWDP